MNLQQWAEATYQNCQDPTIGRDPEETPEIHQCMICGCDFEDGKLIHDDDKWCNSCATEDKIMEYYRDATDYTDGQIRMLNIKEI